MNSNNVNLIAAVALSILIIVGWQYFYERPKLAATVAQQKTYNNQAQAVKQAQLSQPAPITSRAEGIAQDARIKITNNDLNGSISLKGARFDDLTLMNYKQTITQDSPDVALLSPANSKEAYFAQVGWHSSSNEITLPSQDTLFTADKNELSPGSDVTLTWISPEAVKFVINVALDQHYMFTINQSVINESGRPISMQFYGLVNCNYEEKDKAMSILHQGPIAVINKELVDETFEDTKDKKSQRTQGSDVSWIGVTDKYWLTAFVPDQNLRYNTQFSYALVNALDKFQVDFITPSTIIEQNTTYTVSHKLFAGAKKVGLLDEYEQKYNITLFDRAIDFGMFYIMTKPLFNAINFLFRYCGNFGVSILIITVIIKLALFTISSKSYHSMKRMKELHPEIERLKALCGDDKTRFNQEVMELYKRKKINPVSGCLPLLIQIPVFFSLYKVLYVTIEMRHAPFFGWIKDLSAPDPTTAFNLFGLLSFTPPTFLMIGVWPLLMALTMYLQQKMNPEPTDPTQAQVMKFMPLMFLFMFSNFPAGLLIYWTWNNILSIVQQYYVNYLEKA